MATTAAQWPATGVRSLYHVDRQTLHDEFVAESERLFVADDEIDITIIEITARVFSQLKQSSHVN